MILQLGKIKIGLEVGLLVSLFHTVVVILMLLGLSVQDQRWNKLSLKFGIQIPWSQVSILSFVGDHGGTNFLKKDGIHLYKIYMLIKIPSLNVVFIVYKAWFHWLMWGQMVLEVCRWSHAPIMIKCRNSYHHGTQWQLIVIVIGCSFLRKILL